MTKTLCDLHGFLSARGELSWMDERKARFLLAHFVLNHPDDLKNSITELVSGESSGNPDLPFGPENRGFPTVSMVFAGDCSLTNQHENQPIDQWIGQIYRKP